MASLGKRRGAVLPVAFLFAALTTLGTPGCQRTQPNTVEVVPGVTFRRDASAGVQLLDTDLWEANVYPVVVATNVERIRNNFVGDAQTVRTWAEKYRAIGGINGGFFGDTYDQVGHRKQIVNLAVVDGKVIAPNDFVNSSKNPGERFLRSVFGVSNEGVPRITWATGNLKSAALKRYEEPLNPPEGQIWRVRSAVACGPHLFSDGAQRVTAKEERLHSPGRLSRAFVAYDQENGRPRHLVIGRADGMEYDQVAAYLADYFSRVHKSSPRDAMCLDGGPSAQLVYQNEGRLEDAEPTGVLVPTALLLLPRR